MIERVVFFQPRTFAARNYLNSSGDEQVWTPWFALMLAPGAQESGLRVELLDARVSDDWRERVRGLGKTDLLAVSVMTGHAITDALAATHEAIDAGARVVWGGPHVTLFPSETLREAPINAVIPGFGAAAFGGLAAAAARGPWPYEQPKTIQSGVFLPLHNRQARSTTTISALDLIEDWAPYVNSDVAIAERTVNLITSEGCARACTYCSEPQTSSRQWITHEVESSIEIAKAIRDRAGADGFKLHDPNFFHDLDRASLFARRFAEELGLPWAATLHPADLSAMPDSKLAELADLGLARVLVGLESPDTKIVRLAGKRYDPAHIPELVERLATAGIRGMFTFIVGWPGADPGHYERTYECARAVRGTWSEHQAKVHFLEPWPGTPIFTLIQREGFVAPRTLNEWAKIDYYQARYASIHDPGQVDRVREVNRELSPYVDA
ncbi:MAG: radical SAM protein [Gemmatimonadota bacterium]